MLFNFCNPSDTISVSGKKIGDSSLFGEKFKGQNSIFLAFLWVFMQWNHRTLAKTYISVSFFGQKQGPGTSLKCDKNKGQH